MELCLREQRLFYLHPKVQFPPSGKKVKSLRLLQADRFTLLYRLSVNLIWILFSPCQKVRLFSIRRGNYSGNKGAERAYIRYISWRIKKTKEVNQILDQHKGHWEHTLLIMLCRSLGAKVYETSDDLCPKVGAGTDQSIALATSIASSRPDTYYSPNQYANDANFLAAPCWTEPKYTFVGIFNILPE